MFLQRAHSATDNLRAAPRAAPCHPPRRRGIRPPDTPPKRAAATVLAMRTVHGFFHALRVAGQAAHVVVTAALYLSLVAATRQATPGGKPGQTARRAAT